MNKLSLAVIWNCTRLSGAIFAATLALGTLAGEAQAAIPPASEGGASPPVSTAAVRQLVLDAQKALKSGNVRLAIILLKNAVSATPKDGILRAQLGLVLLQSGDAISAERELRQARSDGAADQFALPPLLQAMLTRHEDQKLLDEFLDPGPGSQGVTAADILKARAVALQNLGRPSEAVAAMDHSLALRRDVSGLLARARIAEQQGNLALAKNFSDEALKLDPKNADGLLFKLGLLMLANDNSGALSLSEQFMQLYPDNLAVRLARIEIFLKQKQDARAKAEDEVILAKAPNMAIGVYYKALLQARAGDVKGAWRIAQSLPPEFTQSQASIAIMIAQMAIASDNIESGAAILNAAMAKWPDLVELRLRLAAVRMRQNSPDAALSVLQPIRDSKDPRTLTLLSQVFLKLGQYSDALDVLNKLNTADSGSLSLKRELALVEMQAGQSDQGLKDLIELGVAHPTDPAVVAPLIGALVQAKRFPDALAAAERLGSDPKQRVQALFFRGQILVLQGDTNGAFAAFQKALQLDPKNIPSLYYRAGLYEALRKFPEATRDLQAILAADPKNVTALVKLAEVAARQNQDKNVRAILAQAMALAPKDPSPRIALVRYLTVRNDFKGALSAAAELVRVLPSNADGLAMLGELQLKQGQKLAAIDTLRRLTTLLPRSAKPQMLLADALFANGDRARAAGALSAAASLEPNSAEVRAAQVNLLLAESDTYGAVSTARQFQVANPGTAADLLLADALIKTKQSDQAATVLTQSLAARPNNKVLMRLVQLVVTSGDRKKADSLMSIWLNSHPTDIEVRTAYATFVMEGGDTAKASAQYEQVLRQDANNVAALNNLGWLIQKTDPKRALTMLTHAVKLAPDAPDALDSLGWIKLQQNDPKGALEALSRAHDLRPKDGQLTYHLVLALDANGKHESAKGLLKALLNSGVKFDDLPKAQKLAAAWH